MTSVKRQANSRYLRFRNKPMPTRGLNSLEKSSRRKYWDLWTKYVQMMVIVIDQDFH